MPRNRTAALWAGLLVACGLAFGYGYSWQAYVARKTTYSLPEEAEKRLRNPSPQRRKLLEVLVADEKQQAKQAQQGGATAAAAAAAGGGSSGDAG
ncbi:hypothetical protein C2E21_6008 [Chlorella sorokiniana]|uniref:Uncharacterized protein n=1 Tax=Chlorella sorokiniana TaxID=3076 RepID=A0A2P6TM75_CHLSO|nr:hypothetical protein C2E21_6008 [Chlorella sorokiniana]|eukprot:PRW45429.1 hypothetical protein C2E21_6008 [Chlorella sorokiniana]